MGTEIERKFLVSGDSWRAGPPGVFIRQGYLAGPAMATVRVRVFGEQGYLTVKGSTKGFTRPEYEYPIPADEANQMLDELCSKPLIEKYRYRREYASLAWDIDEFVAENRGLILAEIELTGEDQGIDLPDWVGTEVSDDPRYYNVNLSKMPYTRW